MDNATDTDTDMVTDMDTDTYMDTDTDKVANGYGNRLGQSRPTAHYCKCPAAVATKRAGQGRAGEAASLSPSASACPSPGPRLVRVQMNARNGSRL